MTEASKSMEKTMERRSQLIRIELELTHDEAIEVIALLKKMREHDVMS